MAKAKAIPPIPSQPDIELRLTHAEAQTLFCALGKISGDPDLTVRRHTQDIYNSLYGAGVRYPQRPSAVSLSPFATENDYSTFDGSLTAKKLL